MRRTRARPGLAIWIALACAVVSAAPACRSAPREEPPAGGRVAVPPPPPARARLTESEERIVACLGRFFAGLPDGIGRPDLVPESAEDTIARIRAHTDPWSREAGRLAQAVDRLTPERWLDLQGEVAIRYGREMAAFYERLALVSRFYTEERPDQARAILGGVIAPWREAGAMWVLRVFSEASAEELVEIAFGEEAGGRPEPRPGRERG